jgi:hypothetical protein
MLELTAFSSVAMVIVLFYVFRKPVKQVCDQSPEAVSSVITGIIKGANQFESIISANCMENELECAKRVKVVMDAVKAEKLPNIREAYNEMMGIKSKS